MGRQEQAGSEVRAELSRERSPAPGVGPWGRQQQRSEVLGSKGEENTRVKNSKVNKTPPATGSPAQDG